MNLVPSSKRRTGAQLWLACAGLAAVLVLTPSAQARRAPDHTPPVFAGLVSATTCIPGPSGGGISTSYHLTWEAASDDRTKARGIVYTIYQATQPGGEDFSMPTYVTKRGKTSFDTPKLSSAQSWYFVVRARDRAGNEDTNTVEREGMNLCV